MRRAARTDGNQQAVIDRLRSCGVSVEVIKEPVDLLICHRGETAVMEVKNPDGRDRLTESQVKFIARWPGKIHIVNGPDEAVRAVLGEEVMG